MKMKILVAVLVIALVVLGVFLRQTQNKAEEQHRQDQETIRVLSSQLTNAQSQVTEQDVRINDLKTHLDLLSKEAEGLTNKLVATSDALTKTVAQAKADAEAAAAEIARRDVKIKELELTRDDLEKSMNDLTNQIGTLEGRIAETQRKLAQSEGDRDFLLKELKRLQAEKSELERQFNDLALVREQIRKLKEELSIARRLDWIRRGLYGSGITKGAVLLQRGARPASTNATEPGLNVELSTDGPAKVNAPTNAPPAP